MGWRDHLRIHPACERLPRMSDDELVKLGRDIEANRMHHLPVVMQDSDGVFVLLDGRSRLDAIEAVGQQIKVFDGNYPNRRFFTVLDKVEVGDPVAYVISVNLRRRHFLTREQRDELLDELIKLDPTKSDRQIAKDAGVDPKTVGAHRQELERRVEIPHVEKRKDSKDRSQPANKPRPPKGGGAEAELQRLGAEIVSDNSFLATALCGKLNDHNRLVISTAWRGMSFALQLRIADVARRLKCHHRLAKIVGTLPTAEEAPQLVPEERPAAPSEGIAAPQVKSAAEILAIAIRVRRDSRNRDVIDLCDWVIAKASARSAA